MCRKKELIAFYKDKDKSKATFKAVGDLFSKHEYATIYRALHLKYHEVPSGWEPPIIKGGRIGKVLVAAEEKWLKRITRQKEVEAREQRRLFKEQKKKKRKEKEAEKSKSGGNMLFSFATLGELLVYLDAA